MFLKNIKINILAFIGIAILKLIHITQKWDLQLHPEVIKDWPGTEPVIFAFWHNKQLMMPWGFKMNKSAKTPPVYVLISAHSDGRIIARAMKFLGINSIAGSSTRGGKEAMAEMIEIVKNGNSVVITPDGPRGPIYKVKAGAIKLAMTTGRPIYPVTLKVNRYWEFKSWDKMILPKPFAKGSYIVDKAIFIPPDVRERDFEQYMLILENALNKLESDDYKYSK